MAETSAARGLAGILSFFGVDLAPGQPQLGMPQALAAGPVAGAPRPKGDTGLALENGESHGLAQFEDAFRRGLQEFPSQT